MLKKGQLAPTFVLPDTQGQMVNLQNYLGKKVVIYFYPKDNTPGCTRQACAFRDMQKEFLKRNVVVFGISKDGANSHTQFAKKYDLTFTLLSDEDGKVMESYGAFGTKKMYGKTFLGVTRCTYIVDENGVIEKVFAKANPDTNAQEILDYLDENQ